MRVICALLFSFAIAAKADTIIGRVIGITDGDTITVLDMTSTPHKVRLSGIDAPERTQAFGHRSKESLNDLVFGKDVVVETSKLDRYGRNVGKVIVGGTDANLVQILRGMAWHYKAYKREQSTVDRQAYANGEDEARTASLGLWSDIDPIPPWEFRNPK